ncbi:quinolinate synthase NadA [Pyrobaculum neutrophilum]|uniref:Quinolinate synthase n=1 Tax=Pyrobaculum neutrophilum (strain DSM 2338 / JCM 9278 / NBRC 100436 / V24Sta) TaxID=444157 RepID=B1YCG1_PYRNV|nr:quinolinate synthase NadA [Pyrobaculum neutrophilum]ACB39474.1 quinolinate synthetase complex, A subunit [Pyrobaculum neutrophilum V24Sta]
MDYAAEVRRLKSEKNAVVLAHNYQRPEVQDVADFVGDSLNLSLAARETGASLVVFAGVYFMAETAAILNPNKRVLIPDPNAGCSLADAVDVEAVRRWRERHPGGVVVAYINTRAEVKALADYVCTSANCLKVVEAIPRDKPLLFLPDKYLGMYIAAKTGRPMDIWDGACHVHERLTAPQILTKVKLYRDAEVLIHPECGCGTACLVELPRLGVEPRFLSTEGMVKYVRQSPARRFIVATETGIIYRMAKEAPGKEFIPASEEAVCEYMKLTTIEKVYRSLRDEVYRVAVPEEVAKRARAAIERMFQFA